MYGVASKGRDAYVASSLHQYERGTNALDR